AICVVATAALAATLPPLRRVSLRADEWAAHPPEPAGVPERAPLEPEVEIEGATDDPVEGALAGAETERTADTDDPGRR
ncbi:MAG TPA: hypothetical protein VNP37_06795, partial [Actinomycetospora sp.]|nr:hypothetical protein [Actinomycetospora sp.]